jgi:hypothetical protein
VRRSLLALAAVMLLAAQAVAADLVVGARSDLWFDDNVYGTSAKETSDFSFDIAPTVELSERWSKLRASLYFRPTYEVYFREGRLSGFNYDANGSLEWQPTERTTFSVLDTLMRYRTLRGFSPAQGAQPPVLPGRELFTRNVAQLSMVHRVSPLGTLKAGATHTLWEFDRPLRPDQSSTSASLQYYQLVTPRTRLGGLVSFARQAFDYTGGASSHTDYVNGSITLSFTPAETFSFEASVGPTWIHKPTALVRVPNLVRADLIRINGAGSPLVGVLGTCPLLPGGQPFDGPGCQFFPFPFPNFLRLLDPIPLIGTLSTSGGDSWTYFAGVSLEKQWEKASLAISYKRDQGESSAVNSSSVADTVMLTGSYSLGRRASMTLTTSWESREETRQESAGRLVTVLGTLPATPTLPQVNNYVPVGVAAAPRTLSRARVRSLSTNIGGNYGLSEHLTLRGLVGWTDQNARAGSGFGDLTRFFVTVGFDYEFEPLRW